LRLKAKTALVTGAASGLGEEIFRAFTREGARGAVTDVAARTGGRSRTGQPGGRHTCTDMGSGRWPCEGFRYAACQRSIKYISTSNYWKTPSLTRSVTDRWCYDLSLKSSCPAA